MYYCQPLNLIERRNVRDVARANMIMMHHAQVDIKYQKESEYYFNSWI
jgi:hypothetical protein